MRRFVFTTGAVLALALPAATQDAEVAEEYEITIATEESNQYTGPYGQVRLGSVVINVPNAKVDEKYNGQHHRHTGEPIHGREASVVQLRAIGRRQKG